MFLFLIILSVKLCNTIFHSEPTLHISITDPCPKQKSKKKLIYLKNNNFL